MIRVLVAAASAVVRSGLEVIVRGGAGLELTGVLASNHVAEAIDQSTADVLLIEVSQLNEDWISTLSGSSLAVVILADADPPLMLSAFRAGIRAVLSPDATPVEIVAAICSAAANLIAIQPGAIELLMTESRGFPPTAPVEALSPREVEVLGLLAAGLSNKLIAHQLGISEHTVKFHVASILGKLHASSRTDAVMQGIRRGLVVI